MDEIVPFDGGLQISLRRGIFDNKRVITRVVEFKYQSIQDIANQILPAGLSCICSIGGEVIPQDQWATTFVAVNDSVVFTPCMQNGDTNWGKVILGVVLIIVAVVLAVYADWITGFSFSSGIFYYGLALIVGSAGASMLITAFMPIPELTAATPTEETQSSIQQWTPRTTQIQGGVLQRYYGTHKVSGNIIAANIENIGNKQYLYALVCLGLGPYKGIRDIIINKIKMENIRDVRITTTLGYLSQPSLPGFEDTIVNYADSQKLLYNIPVVRQTITDSFDELTIKMLFPQGLGYVSDSGTMTALSVALQVKVKGPADANWTVIPESRTAYQVQIVTKGMWVAVCQIYLNTYVMPQEYAGFYGLVYSTDPKAHSEGDLAISFNDDAGYSTYTWHWTALESYMATQYHDYIIISQPIGRNRIPVELKYKIPSGRKGQYDICVTRLTADYDEVRYIDDVYYIGYATTVYDDFTYPRHALVSVRALNTDQLNGSFDFSCILDGAYVHVYNENTQNWSIEWSDNPAWIAYDILTSPLFNDTLTDVIRYDGEDPSRVDLDSFVFFANFCNALQPEEKSQSVVTGTDGLKYKCIGTHVSTLPTRPVDGIHKNAIPVMTSNTLPSGDIRAHCPEAPNCQSWIVTDKSKTSLGYYWRGIPVAGTSPWLQYTFTTPKCISKIVLSFVIDYYAKDFVVEAYDGANWIILYTKTNWEPHIDAGIISFSSESFPHEFTFDNFVYYTKYRIRFTRMKQSQGYVFVKIMEMHERGEEWNDYWEVTGDGTPETWTLGQKYYCGFEKRYTFNGGFDTRNSRWKAALNVCASAQATLIKIGTKTKVIVDCIRTPRQLFSEGNMISWTEKFLNLTDRATEIEVDFVNKDNDYQKDKISVFHSNAPAVYGTFNMPAFGLVKKSEIWRLAKHHVTQNQRRHAMEINVDIESIISMVGDTVYVQSEMCDWAVGERGGSILEGTSTTVVIDKTFTADDTKTYSIAIRLSNDEVVIKELTHMNGEYTTLTIKSGTWGTIDPQFGDPYVVGELSKMVKLFSITGITPNENHGAAISLIEYDESWYSQINDAMPEVGDWVVGQDTQSITYVIIDEVIITEETYVNESGVMARKLCVSWTASTTGNAYSKGRVQYRTYHPITNPSSMWNAKTPVAGYSDTITGVLANTSYEVRVTGIDALGIETPFESEDAHSAYITTSPILNIIQPPVVSGLQIFGQGNNTIFTGRDCRIVWNPLQSLATTVAAGNELIGAGQHVPEFEWRYEVIIKNPGGYEQRKLLVSKAEYTYQLEENYSDTDGEPIPAFSIEVRGLDQWGRFSQVPSRLSVTNSTPIAPTEISATGIVGGISVTWEKSAEEDFACYEYRKKIGTGSFENWIEIHDNTVLIQLTSIEITENGLYPDITAEVRTKDCYNQTSSAVSVITTANSISDSIFQITATSSGGIGDVEQLYDGNLTTNALFIQ